eukprot:GILJ01019278.1.p2 GENE.GILJ01019278.1~~GILJ01019278.1.p2  ORF type:complete len:359 (+),score=39.27 GILJ01019278.1:1162-2238(+)
MKKRINNRRRRTQGKKKVVDEAYVFLGRWFRSRVWRWRYRRVLIQLLAEQVTVCPVTPPTQPTPTKQDQLQIQQQQFPPIVRRSADCYEPTIHHHLREEELQYMPSPQTFRTVQPHITENMRLALIDWLIAVHERYNLDHETLYLCVNILDRFLSVVAVKPTKLQLIGVTCLWIASKYEDILPPTVDDMSYMTDNSSSTSEIIAMEKLILHHIGFQVSISSPWCFLKRYAAIVEPQNTKLFHSACYIMELSLMRYQNGCDYCPSLIASAALYKSLKGLGMEWTNVLQSKTGYHEAELAATASHLDDIPLSSRNSIETLDRKYKKVVNKQPTTTTTTISGTETSSTTAPKKKQGQKRNR